MNHCKNQQIENYRTFNPLARSISETLLGFFLLVTSIVLLPIKGTTPSFLLCFSLILYLLTSQYRNQTLLHLVLVFLVFILLYSFSQLFLAISYVRIPESIPRVGQGSALLNKSFLTQSLYLVPGLLLYFYVRLYFNARLLKFIWFGIYLLLGYGLYELVHYALTGQYNDFLSNRTFGEDASSGSLVQSLNIGPIRIQRMKSLTGEPSMFAYSILPFWILATELKKRKTAFLLILALILSTSGTAIMGIAVYSLARFKDNWLQLRYWVYLFFILLTITVLIYSFYPVFQFFWEFIYEKYTMQSVSGKVRSGYMLNAVDYWRELNFGNKLFGIGFGTVRSTDLFSTLLVNTGMVGVLFYSYICLSPFYFLKKSPIEKGVKYGLLIIYLTSMISVPEFSYLNFWFFLGLSAYLSNHQLVKVHEYR